FQFADTLSYTAGRHNFKFGGDLRAPMRNIYLDIPAMRGDMSFTGQFTGNPLADFLLGYVGQAQTSVFTQVDQRLWMLSFFAQDDWKVTPLLTLNLGLRYDFATWPYEGANRMANLDPATGQLIFASDGSLADRTLIKTDKNNFAPRIGIAYQLDEKTVLRTGYGRFYQLFERAGSEDQLALNPPFLINVAVSTSSRNDPIFLLEDGFPASFRDPASLDLSRIRLRAVNPDSVMPTVDHWNFGIQRLFPGDILATADYVGTKGTHLSVLRNLNQVDFATRQLPFPNLGVIEFRDNAVNSTYHGLELTVEKRFGQGLSLRSAYTYSKSIDQAQEHLFGGGSNSFLQNSRDLRQQRGLSDFDYRHRYVLSYVYELPFGAGRPYLEKGVGAYLLGGWRMSGIFSHRSGRPFTVFASGNNAFVGAFANALCHALSS
ncbi:MAG TPA: TonB-dependent receptor, partial [Blastocatellia bacterium]|nr:TonB-dependent receptor [Blastocatellia bacterium]